MRDCVQNSVRIVVGSLFILHCGQWVASRAVTGSSRALPFENCGSQFEILEIDISSCPLTTARCRIPIGQTVNVTTEFQMLGNFNSAKLTHEAYWILQMISRRAHVTPEACESSGCPIKGNDGMVFTAQLLVNATLPGVRGNIQWELRDEFSKIMICYRVPIELYFPATPTSPV